MEFIDGIKDMLQGVGQVMLGAGKAVFAFLKTMLFAAVCVIVGVYHAIKGVFDFAKKAYQKLKKERPEAKLTSTGNATKKVLEKVLGDIKTEVARDTLNLSALEKDEVLNDVNEIEGKIIRGEANGMRWVEGKNEQGANEIFDAELISYEQLSDDDKRRDAAETAFIQNIS